jgi:hypothetical protein
MGTRARRTDKDRRGSSSSASDTNAYIGVDAHPAGRARKQTSIQGRRASKSFRKETEEVKGDSEKPSEGCVESRRLGRFLQICQQFQVDEQFTVDDGWLQRSLECVQVDKRPRCSRKWTGGHQHRVERATKIITIDERRGIQTCYLRMCYAVENILRAIGVPNLVLAHQRSVRPIVTSRLYMDVHRDMRDTSTVCNQKCGGVNPSKQMTCSRHIASIYIL